MNINSPKEEVMEILPFVIGKAILIAFEEKIKEKLTAVLRSNIEESEVERKNDCEDMVYLFVIGLCSTQEVSLSAVNMEKKLTLSRNTNTMFKSVIDMHKVLLNEHGEKLGTKMLS
jgi:hypothetical protein